MRRMSWSFLILGLLATPALAQQPAPTPAQAPSTTPPSAPQQPEAAASKRATITVGSDFTSAYMFRGVFQVDSGAIIQPYVDVGVALGKGVTLNVGNWESHHSVLEGKFYESDYYASVTGTAGKWKPGVLFTSYTSPKDAFKTVNEIAGVLAYDDSASVVPLSPKIVIAQELKGQADGGLNKGTYLEAGMRPVVKLVKSRTPVNLAIPLKVGLSLKDYYEYAAGAIASDTFGYFDIGFIASVPVSTSKGTWEFHGGVDFLTLGDNMKILNGGDKVKPVASLGLSFVY